MPCNRLLSHRFLVMVIKAMSSGLPRGRGINGVGRTVIGYAHMLHQSCSSALANKGMDTRLMQDWLGHRDIRNTAKYCRPSAKRFNGVWE